MTDQSLATFLIERLTSWPVAFVVMALIIRHEMKKQGYLK